MTHPRNGRWVIARGIPPVAAAASYAAHPQQARFKDPQQALHSLGVPSSGA